MAHWRPIAGSLSCVFGQDTFSVRLSTQEYRWVPAKCTNNVQVPIFADSSLLFFFLFFKYFVVPQHSYFRIKVSEWWRNVDYCFICFEMLDSHDVQREQFSTSVPRGFTLLYHVVGQVISGCQLCVDHFKAYSHPSPGIWTFKDFFFPLRRGRWP